MRTAKEMAKYCPIHHNFQLVGSITYDEFKFIQNKISELEKIPGHIDDKNYWDHVVISESLFRDRKSVYTRYHNRFKKEGKL